MYKDESSKKGIHLFIISLVALLVITTAINMIAF